MKNRFAIFRRGRIHYCEDICLIFVSRWDSCLIHKGFYPRKNQSFTANNPSPIANITSLPHMVTGVLHSGYRVQMIINIQKAPSQADRV